MTYYSSIKCATVQCDETLLADEKLLWNNVENTHAHALNLTFVRLRMRCMVGSHVYIANAIEIETQVLFIVTSRKRKIESPHKIRPFQIENENKLRCVHCITT